ncbi:hypothetical protein [Lactococcus garvieae]|uniref:hypothetical protein n=1 Tax=Lactococcus garvieae TaxID=1363 RepID=UPI00254CC4FA|nr:hypothetical protein [Lactococcus garvieae]
MIFEKTKFLRYQIIGSNDKLYLIDLDGAKSRIKINSTMMEFNYKASEITVDQYNFLIKKSSRKVYRKPIISISLLTLIGVGIGNILFKFIGLNKANKILTIGLGQPFLLLNVLLFSIGIIILSRFILSLVNKKKIQNMGLVFEGELSIIAENNRKEFSPFMSGMSIFYLISFYFILIAMYLSGYGVIIVLPVLLMTGFLFIFKTKSRNNDIGILGNKKLVNINYKKLST